MRRPTPSETSRLDIYMSNVGLRQRTLGPLYKQPVHAAYTRLLRFDRCWQLATTATDPVHINAHVRLWQCCKQHV